MASPYANPYGDLTKVNVRGPSASERQRGAQASQQSNLLRMLSSAAPAAGQLVGGGIGALAAGLSTGGLGAGAGAALGAGIGGGIGQLAGSAGNMAADENTRPYEEADIKRRASLDAIQRVLRGL